MGACNRHVLTAAKSNARWEVIADIADDETVRMQVSQQAQEVPGFARSLECASDSCHRRARA